MPVDPLTGEPFKLVRTEGAIAVLSAEKVEDEDVKPLGFELKLK